MLSFFFPENYAVWAIVEEDTTLLHFHDNDGCENAPTILHYTHIACLVVVFIFGAYTTPKMK